MPQSTKARFTRRRVPSRRLIGLVCVGLGILFAFAPILHGLFHVGGMPHRHPAGSMHSHANGHSVRTSQQSHRLHHAGQGHTHRHDHGADVGTGERHESGHGSSGSHGHTHHRHVASAHEKAKAQKPNHRSNQPTDSKSPGDPRSPLSDDDCPLFFTLEIDASGSIAFQTECVTAAPHIDSLAVESLCVFDRRELGLIGPRGPPA